MAGFVTIPLFAALAAGPSDTRVDELSRGTQVLHAKDPEYYGVGTVKHVRVREAPDGVKREREHAEVTVDWGTETTTEPEWNLLLAQPGLGLTAGLGMRDSVRKALRTFAPGTEVKDKDFNPTGRIRYGVVEKSEWRGEPSRAVAVTVRWKDNTVTTIPHIELTSLGKKKPQKSLFTNLGRVKTAISLPDLVRQTNAFSKKYRGGCSPRLLDSNPKALFLHYNVKCNKEDSDPAGHDVRVQFDVSKVQETAQAKDLDIQVQCSCPAFLYWGAQWNLHQRDGLLGPARPELQAPQERLDLRGNYVICKHIHAVFERILPSVQHNIVKILREREKERKKDELDKTPERLQKEQEQMKKRKEVEKVRKTKNKEIQDKLLEALRKQEEARMLHEEDLDDQGAGEPGEVGRTEPATDVQAPAPKHEPTPTTLPEPEREIADINDLTDQEEQKIEQLHEEHKPHEHKGLPYEEEEGDEGWQGERLSSKTSSADEPGLLWRAPEDNERHDYQPSWDYEPRENVDPDLAQIAVRCAQAEYQRTKQPFELWDVDLTHTGAVAMYIDGTCGYPVVLVDLEAHRDHQNQIGKSIDHELRHAMQENEGREYDEDEAEAD